MRIGTAVKRERKNREKRWARKSQKIYSKFLHDNTPRLLPGNFTFSGRENCQTAVIGKLVPNKLNDSNHPENFVWLYLPKLGGENGTQVFSINGEGVQKKMEVISLFVPHGKRGMGYGGKLLNHAIKIARENGVTKIQAITKLDPGFAKMCKLLFDRGFRIIGWPDRQKNVTFEKKL